ncbi:hypothetical protein ENUP19_0047G0156 [Entamoeba nuttalli]|uniref:Jessie 3a n=1 Tax=Entamoeba nuttalli TaxID=412467 RepID=A0ABQ0DBL7_9EUKA
MKLAVLTVTIFMTLSYGLNITFGQRTNCDGLESGFYCVDSTTYYWCYGQSRFKQATCPNGLECKCGKTIYNPCMWPFQGGTPDCDGKPGKYFSGTTPDEPSESSTVNPPEDSSSVPPSPDSSSVPPSPDSSSTPVSSSSHTPEPSESSSQQKSESSSQQKSESSSQQKSESSTSQSSNNSGDDDYNPDWPDVEKGVYSMAPNTHLPLVLKFDKNKWKEQIKEVVSNANYNNEALYQPATSDYDCALHPPSKYDNNPTQIWIGRPSQSVTISYTPGVAIRLPDKYYGMFLGYAMDAYGLNPGMLIGLGAKESFSFARYQATDDGSYFIVANENEHYDCYSSSQRGLCRDGNLDGPFQVETGGMSTDVAILPNRFWIGESTTPKSERKIKYMFDNEVLTYSGFRAYHDYFTLNYGRAFVLTSLDFHFRHNLVMNMKKVGLRDALSKRTKREQRDSLEFATAMYTYNRGVFDTQLIQMLNGCNADMDPCTDCKLDGYGGHTTDIRIVCKAVDSVPNKEVYDYNLNKEDVEYFISTIQSTYPFNNVDWKTLRSDVDTAYDYLKSKRNSNAISFRYDWRTLLAVIRMHLPPIEYFVGDQVKTFQDYWGGVLNDDLGPYQSVSNFPFKFCSTSGGRSNLCSSKSHKQVHYSK